MDTATLLVLGLLAALVVIALVRKPPSSADLSTTLQNLTQVVQQQRTETVVLSEKVAQLEPMTRVVAAIQTDLRGLSEAEKARQEVELRALEPITRAVSVMQTELTGLSERTKARQEIETRTADSIRRLETIIAGTQTRGAAGENILEVVFAKLPPDWQVRDFRVGDKVVEFGLRLPNSLILPIDSKWSATGLLEQLVATEDITQQQRLRREIETAVLARAKEVRKYIHPDVTVNFGVAAIPDAVYELSYGIQSDVFQLNVVLVSYSMFVPYLLLVFQAMLSASQSIDPQKLDAYLKSAQESIKILQEELEGRFARAVTMLSNSRSDMAVHLSRLNSGLAGIQVTGRASTVTALPGQGSVEPEQVP